MYGLRPRVFDMYMSICCCMYIYRSRGYKEPLGRLLRGGRSGGYFEKLACDRG